jgi:hypothetical protein
MITRQIQTRTVEAVWRFLCNDADYFALAGGVGVEGEPGYTPPATYMGSFFELANMQIAPRPRQIHVYGGDAGKEPDSGKAWTEEFEVIIEYFSQRNEGVWVAGAVTVSDEVKEIANRLYVGQSPRSPGRFIDPDAPSPDAFITLGINRVVISRPRVPPEIANAAVLRFITVTFTTREDAEGRRI